MNRRQSTSAKGKSPLRSKSRSPRKKAANNSRSTSFQRSVTSNGQQISKYFHPRPPVNFNSAQQPPPASDDGNNNQARLNRGIPFKDLDTSSQPEEGFATFDPFHSRGLTIFEQASGSGTSRPGDMSNNLPTRRVNTTTTSPNVITDTFSRRVKSSAESKSSHDSPEKKSSIYQHFFKTETDDEDGSGDQDDRGNYLDRMTSGIPCQVSWGPGPNPPPVRITRRWSSDSESSIIYESPREVTSSVPFNNSPMVFLDQLDGDDLIRPPIIQEPQPISQLFFDNTDEECRSPVSKRSRLSSSQEGENNSLAESRPRSLFESVSSNGNQFMGMNFYNATPTASTSSSSRPTSTTEMARGGDPARGGTVLSQANSHPRESEEVVLNVSLSSQDFSSDLNLCDSDLPINNNNNNNNNRTMARDLMDSSLNDQVNTSYLIGAINRSSQGERGEERGGGGGGGADDDDDEFQFDDDDELQIVSQSLPARNTNCLTTTSTTTNIVPIDRRNTTRAGNSSSIHHPSTSTDTRGSSSMSATTASSSVADDGDDFTDDLVVTEELQREISTILSQIPAVVSAPTRPTRPPHPVPPPQQRSHFGGAVATLATITTSTNCLLKPKQNSHSVQNYKYSAVPPSATSAARQQTAQPLHSADDDDEEDPFDDSFDEDGL